MIPRVHARQRTRGADAATRSEQQLRAWLPAPPANEALEASRGAATPSPVPPPPSCPLLPWTRTPYTRAPKLVPADSLDFVLGKIQEGVTTGAHGSIPPGQARWLTSAHVVPSAGKHRLVVNHHDLNAACQTATCRYESIDYLVQLLIPHSWLFSYDLVAAYHHCRGAPQHSARPSKQPRMVCLRYTLGLGWQIHCGVEVTELITNKQHIIISARTNKRHHHLVSERTIKDHHHQTVAGCLLGGHPACGDRWGGGVESAVQEGCPRTMTGVSQCWFSGHFRQLFFKDQCITPH